MVATSVFCETQLTDLSAEFAGRTIASSENDSPTYMVTLGTIATPVTFAVSFAPTLPNIKRGGFSLSRLSNENKRSVSLLCSKRSWHSIIFETWNETFLFLLNS